MAQGQGIHRSTTMDMFAKLDKEIKQQEDSVAIPLYYQDGTEIEGCDGNQATISVVAAGSSKVRAARRANTQRILNSRRKKVSPEQLDEAGVRELVAAVTGWTLPDKDGGPWPFTSDNVHALFTKYLFIQEQVEEGVAAHASFFEKQSKS